MSHIEADGFVEKYEKEEIVLKEDDPFIESHQIEALMSALKDESDYMLLEKICVQYRIQDVTEFNLERLS